MSLPQSELWDELTVDTAWFHVVRSMVMSDRIAQIGVNAWAVYSVLKAYTQFTTGKSWPSQDTIATHIGLSVDTVQRALDRLIEEGIVEKKRAGRHNEYRLIESFPIKRTDTGEPYAVAQDFYEPQGFQRLVTQLKALVKNGEVPQGASFTVNFNFVQQGDGGSVQIGDVHMNSPQATPQDNAVVAVQHPGIRRMLAASRP